ncbi:hypothetical protein DIS24_g4396 [Lasiodiplodia hormozganensis]|uniref:Uncharacterized protein n=1 Tax=Lasiodiplodia hormozganensis TaxID=869390 RepID=A0AA39YUE9_9PEZI|nr:hypothetical protein DIS24_g4396 [Lasiodiplodia hormozganensis]
MAMAHSSVEVADLPSLNSFHINTTPEWKRTLLSKASVFRDCVKTNNFADVYYFSILVPPKTNRKAFYSSSTDDTLPDDVKYEMKSLGEATLTKGKEAADDFKTTTAQLKVENAGREKWREKVQATGQTAKDRFNEAVDNWVDKTIVAIEELPEDQREAAADFWGLVSNGVMAALGEVFKFFQMIVQAVIDWVVDMWEKVKEFFSTIGDAINTGINWIRGLF